MATFASGVVQVIDGSAEATARVGISASTDDELIDAMVLARRKASQAQAEELTAVAELARRRRAETSRPRAVERVSPEDHLVDEVAAALTLTTRAAADLIDFATALRERLPETLAALSSGDVDYCKARTIWHGTLLLDEALTARVEDAVLERAAEQTTGEIQAKIRRLVRKLDPDAFDRRRRNAEAQRRVELIGDDNGTAHLSGCDLPVDAADSAYKRINAIATALRADGDGRGIDQLRADVFLGLLHGRSDLPQPPVPAERRTARPTDPARSWTTLDDLTAEAIAQAIEAELARLPDDGTLPERHRDLAATLEQILERVTDVLGEFRAQWCAPWVAASGDSAGSTTHGASSYRPPAAMRRMVEERDGRCRYPGCRRRAWRADIDHTHPYNEGGATCPCNLAVLCRRHHRLKQSEGWSLLHVWPGVLVWITPTGHWRIVRPTDRE